MTAYGPLAQIALGSTSCIALCASGLSRRPVLINGVLVIFVTLALLLYSFFMAVSPLDLPRLFLQIVFEDSVERKCILTFWIVNVLVSVIFAVLTTWNGTSSTVHRKFFHLTVSLIYISGLFFEKDFVWLCGWLWLCIFVLLELLRYFNVPPWADTLNNYLLVFRDDQDLDILMTPIFLLLGIFLPLFLSSGDDHPHLYHLAGVASVGVGDALAAVIGTYLGRHRWPGRRTTIEGSSAMFLGVWIFLIFSMPYCYGPRPSVAYCCLVAALVALIEAFLHHSWWFVSSYFLNSNTGF